MREIDKLARVLTDEDDVSEEMRDIESLNFAARVGIANGWKMFIRAISRQPSVSKLLYDLESDTQLRQSLLDRITTLSAVEHNGGRNLHPYDTAVAVYLILLSLVGDYIRAHEGAMVASEIDGVWWTARAVEEINRLAPAVTGETALKDRTVPLFARLSPRTRVVNRYSGRSTTQG